jgi:hypothetical protein
MNYLMLLLVLFVLSKEGPYEINGCTPAGEKDCTYWGQKHAIFDRQSKAVRVLRGQAIDGDGKAVTDALVEIYAYHDYYLKGLDYSIIPKCSQRIAACITGINGAFQFDVDNGLYELRVSKPSFTVFSVLICIDRQKGKKKDIEVKMEVGT